MRPFERLLYASDSELKRIFQQFDANPTGSPDRIGDAIAQNLGLDRSQLLCGCGRRHDRDGEGQDENGDEPDDIRGRSTFPDSTPMP